MAMDFLRARHWWRGLARGSDVYVSERFRGLGFG